MSCLIKDVLHRQLPGQCTHAKYHAINFTQSLSMLNALLRNIFSEIKRTENEKKFEFKHKNTVLSFVFLCAL